MPDDQQIMLSKRLDRFEMTVTQSINKMSESITELAKLMAEKAANDRHVEVKLDEVKQDTANLNNRMRAVETYISVRGSMQKYWDFGIKSIISAGSVAAAGGLFWATAKYIGII